MRRTFAAAFGALALTFAGIASASANHNDVVTTPSDPGACGELTFETSWAVEDHKVDTAQLVVLVGDEVDVFDIGEPASVGPFDTETVAVQWRVWGGGERDYDDPALSDLGALLAYLDAEGSPLDAAAPGVAWHQIDVEGCVDDGTDDGTDGGAEDGTDGGAEDGTDGGAEDGAEGGAEDGADGGAEDGTDGGAEDGAEGGAEDGADGGAEDGTDAGAEDGADGGAEGGAEDGAEGGAEDGADDGSSACDAYVGSSEWCDDGVPDYNCTDSNPDVPAVPAEHQPVDLVDSDDDPFGLDADNDGVGCENGGGSDDGAEDGGDGGAESGTDSSTDNGTDSGTDELPDTGMGSTLLTLAGVSLLAGGAVLMARRRLAL